ncbi:MAG: class I SAM-dependent methyltransferase [Actinomycetota bacterium]|nr:class I SAM-dependent methyltransferase [Actinomycetota bacterium]
MATKESTACQVLGVDDEGIAFRADADEVVDVTFDGRRIWSFWLLRDSVAEGAERRVGWPAQLKRFLDGRTRLSLVAHVSGSVLYDEEMQLGSSEERIAVVNAKGQPLGLDKSNRISQTFDTRSAEHVAPLLDSIEEVLGAIKAAGIEAFPAYGTLLGAVRQGRLIAHDSDADLGYVSRHHHPVDVVRESFELQRALTEAGYRINRYSGAAFKVDVIEGDGSVRGLDVFAGFLRDGRLYLMGEIGEPFEEDWIYPLGTTTLEGRTLPAPAKPDRLLEATYGRCWRVPDPAYRFTTPDSTARRLNGWFRGIRVHRNEWDRRYSTVRMELPPPEPSDLAQYLVERQGLPERLVDLGAGRGGDARWFAQQGVSVTALDFVPWSSRAVQLAAHDEQAPLAVRPLNLHELRSVLAEGTRLAHEPGPRTILCRHLVDATDARGRDSVWRLCDMALRDGGELYLQFLRGRPGGRRTRDFLSRLSADRVVKDLQARGATIVQREDDFEVRPNGDRGRAIGRVVARWQS